MYRDLATKRNRIVVKPIEQTEQMYGNIIIADMGKERPEMGEVIAVGPGRMSEYGKFVPVNVNVGDIVLLPKIGTIRVEFDGCSYYRHNAMRDYSSRVSVLQITGVTGKGI